MSGVAGKGSVVVGRRDAFFNIAPSMDMILYPA